MPKEVKSLANYGSDQLVKDAGSLSFFTPLGTKDDVDEVVYSGESYTPKFGAENAGDAVPGICVVDYNIVPGRSIDGTSGLNIAAKKLYTFVRHANSGSRNYDSPDLMNFAFSGVSLFTFIVECQRVYGVIQRYSCKNRYLAKSLVQALGFDYEDLSSKLADFRAMLNVAINKLNAIKIPAAWPLWNKNYSLNAIVLKDGEIDRSQLYAYRSTVIWKYNETGPFVGSLTPEFIFGMSEDYKLTVADVKDVIDNIVNAFVASEDINIMSGDIVKAYGEEKCMELGLIAEEYMIDPIYNREMLDVLHNTTVYEVAKGYTANGGMIIKQDTVNNNLLFDPFIIRYSVADTFSDNKGAEVTVAAGTKEYIDLMRDDVQPIDVVNSSIMTALPDGAHPVMFEDERMYHMLSFGTEIAVNCKIYCYILRAGGLTLEHFDLRRKYFMGTANSATSHYQFVNGIFAWITQLTKFEWHPRVTIYIDQNEANTDSYIASAAKLYDLYNYTVVSEVELSKLHDLHILGGFGLAE